MAYVNTPKHEQEMVGRETEQSNYSSLTQRREDEAPFSEIQPNDRIQRTTDQLGKKVMCNCKIKFGLIILGVVVLVVLSSVITAVILKQNIDSNRDEIVSIKLTISKDLVSKKPAMDQVLDNTWSIWSPWGDCSVTCNGGIRKRTRTCDSTDQGEPQGSCSGNNVDITGCNNKACIGNRGCNNKACDGPEKEPFKGSVTFDSPHANVGGGYNDHTGDFICPVAGLYHFYFSFMQKSTTYVSCWLKHNGEVLTQAETYSDNTYASVSTSAYVQLAVGDVVNVCDCNHPEHIYDGYEGVFTEALIHP